MLNYQRVIFQVNGSSGLHLEDDVVDLYGYESKPSTQTVP